LRYVAEQGFEGNYKITRCQFNGIASVLDTSLLEWVPIVSQNDYIVLFNGDTLVHLRSWLPVAWERVIALTGFGDVRCDAEGCSADVWLWVEGKGRVSVFG